MNSIKILTHKSTKSPILKINNEYYIQHWNSLANPIFHTLNCINTNKSFNHPKYKSPFNLILNPPKSFINQLN